MENNTPQCGSIQISRTYGILFGMQAFYRSRAWSIMWCLLALVAAGMSAVNFHNLGKLRSQREQEAHAQQQLETSLLELAYQRGRAIGKWCLLDIVKRGKGDPKYCQMDAMHYADVVKIYDKAR